MNVPTVLVPPAAPRQSFRMPLARIDVPRGKSPDYRRTIGEVVYEAMIKTINVPANDRFQIITEHAPEDLVIDGLHQRLGLRKQDVFITLVEVKKENWSFGNGEAQYA
jgi:4-oxalocrotonate tautomerase